MQRTTRKCPARDGALQEVACAPVPTVAPDQSGVCGAVSRPAHRGPAAWEGRVEHVVSGQAAHFHSLEELLAFIARVLTAVQERPGA